MYDEDLYYTIYRDNYSAVQRTAQGILHDEYLSYDMAQEVFIKLYKCMIDDYIINNYHGWLIATVKHMCINYLGKYCKNKVVEYNENLQIYDNEHCVDDTIYISTLLERLYAKNSLWYNIFYYHYILGIKYSEIARRYNISISTVQRIIRKSKRYLQDIYAPIDFLLLALFIAPLI